MVKHYKLILGMWFFVLLLWSLPAPAEWTVDTAWVRRYNGPGNSDDEAHAVAVDDSGNVYVTGVSGGEYATIKYRSNGEIGWVKRFGYLANCAYAIAVDDSGNVCVTGYGHSSSSLDDYATIKYRSNGDTAWVRRYNGPGNTGDQAHAIAVNDSGNIYVTGYSWGGDVGLQYATIKYYPNGDTAWVRRYGQSLSASAAIALDYSGNVYVTGFTTDTVTGVGYATIKYYPNGDTVWVRRYSGPIRAPISL